ncbi:MAG TPA: tetratricopeptide repeat protein [Pyrinomonadaceae bacterium]|nr:tetratricopeptide repeat protein [Pyrinomonadaceae bacterium]
MNKSNFFAALVSLSVILTASACYKAPTANTSRSSTTTTATSTPATADKTTSPVPSVQTSPAKSGNYEQALNDYNAKNFDKAETGFKDVLASDPKNADAHYYLGNIYYNRKDYETSLPHFEQAAKIDFKSVEKIMAWGENQRTLKQFDRAIVQFQKVIGFDPNNANAYYALGLTYIGLNNKIGARQQLQKLEPLNKPLADKLSKEIDNLK